MEHCPSEQDFVALVTGQLPESAVATIHAHIDSCMPCHSLLAEMGRATDPAFERDAPIVDPDCYEIEAHLFSGGLGHIFRARDLRLGRVVAIKQLRVQDAAALARFRREALITARLQHPAIVPVHEAGRWPSGEPFYAMKLVTGRSLHEVIAETGTLDGRLALLPRMIAVAEAIAYAHQESVIHRDITPANILVGAFGETVVIDWGLAKPVGAESNEEPDTGVASSGGEEITVNGTVIGTPAYMPPEQAGGEVVDERADVYALGAVLYHLLSGEAPYKGRSPAELLGHVLSGPPLPVEAVVPDVPPDLAAIVRKAMARDRADRYVTASELAVDLERFQAGRLVAAHHYGRGTLLLRWLRRYRAIVALGTMVLLTLASAVGANVMRFRTARDQEQRRRYDLMLSQARNALFYDPTSALAWVKAYLQAGTDPRAAHQIATEALSRGVARHLLHGPVSSWGFVDISPDGARVASGPHVWELASGLERALAAPESLYWAQVSFLGADRLIAASFSPNLYVWDLTTGARRELVGSGEEWNYDTTSDKQWVVAGGSDGIVRLWNLATAEGRILGRHKGAIASVVISPDGEWAATASDDGDIALWPLRGGAPVRLVGHDGAACEVAWSPDGRWLASTGHDGTARLWNLASRTATLVSDQANSVIRPGFAPDGQWVASAEESGAIRLHNPTTGATRALDGHRQGVTALLFLPTGDLASAGGDRTVRIWDLAKGGARELAGFAEPVRNLAVSRDGKLLVTGTYSGAIQVWPIDPSPVTLPVPDRGHLSIAAHSQDGARFAVADEDGHVYLGDFSDGRIRALPLRGRVSTQGLSADGKRVAIRWRDQTIHVCDFERASCDWAQTLPDPIALARLSPDGRYMAAVSRAGAVRWWDLASGALHTGAIGPITSFSASFAFSADSRWLYAINGQQLVLWSTATGEARNIKTLGGEGNEALLSPDDQFAVIVTRGRTVFLVDVAAGTTRVLGSHTDTARLAAWSPDGQRVATTGNDRVLRLWDVHGGGGRALLGPSGPANVVAFSPDGSRLAVAGGDGVVRIWSVEDGLQRRILRGHTDALYDLAFSTDGRRLRTIGRDHIARDWRLDDARETPSLPALRGWLERQTTAEVASDDTVRSMFREAQR